MKNWIFIVILVLFAGFVGFKISKRIDLHLDYQVGQPIDSLHGVKVYYNGGTDNVTGRNIVHKDNYNIGLRYQCVEFVKRYYYEHYNHKMPETRGHAKDFFESTLSDGELNKKRGLVQYKNPGAAKPKVGDIVVMSPSFFNKYGHVAIVSKVDETEVELIQQNPGPFADSRIKFDLEPHGDKWNISNEKIVGWLRKPTQLTEVTN